MGIPSNQSKIQPVAAVSLIRVASFIAGLSPLFENAVACGWIKRSVTTRTKKGVIPRIVCALSLSRSPSGSASFDENQQLGKYILVESIGKMRASCLAQTMNLLYASNEKIQDEQADDG